MTTTNLLAGLSTEAKQDDLLTRLDAISAQIEAGLQTSVASSVLPLGAATDLGLAAILAKLPADPATQATLVEILARLSTDPASQTTLAAVLAKISEVLSKLSADPASQTTLASILAVLSGTLTTSGTATISGTPNVAIAAVSNTVGIETSTPLGAGATYTGTVRNAGSTNNMSRFCVRVYCDQACTLIAEQATVSGGPFYLMTAPVSVPPGVPATIDERMTTQYSRARLINGATAQTVLFATYGLFRI